MIYDDKKSKSGFTLIELMVVLFIIGILSAVAIPYMRGRSDVSKWSEGKAVAGTIRTAARTFCAEMGMTYTYPGTGLCDIGFSLRSCPTPAAVSDLDGRYFSEECYNITFTGYDQYSIVVTAGNAVNRPDKPSTPAVVTLTSAGNFTES